MGNIRRNIPTGGIIFFGALIVRLLIIFATKSYENLTLWEYDTIAKNILNGEGFVYESFGTTYYAFLPPLYPIFCAVLYKITNFNYLFALIFQSMISAGLCAVIFFISKRIFGKTVASIACLFTIFHPGLLVYSTKTLHVLTIDSFLFALFILVLFKLREQYSIRNQLAAGVILGLCILTRATVILFLPLAIIWLIWNAKEKRKRMSSSIVFVILISVLVITPWTVRNYLHYKRFIFIRANSWDLLWLGNNPNASGALYCQGDKTVANFVPKEIIGESEDVQNVWFKKEVLNFWRENPFTALKLYFKKIYHFWWFSEFSGKEYPASWLLIYKVYYSFILITFLYGIWKIFSADRYKNIRYASLLILILLCSICFMQSLFYVEGRHRWEVESLMLIFTSFCLVNFLNILKYKKPLNLRSIISQARKTKNA